MSVLNPAGEKRVLITGVEGFTGRYLAPLLANSGYAVHGLAQQAPAEPIPGVSCVHPADLADAASVAEVVRTTAPDRVVHLAGISNVAADDAALVYMVNLVGTRHLLQALAALPSGPQAVLLASSANVYGNATGGVLDESTPPAPANDYAVSKLAMEYVAGLYRQRLPLIICRPFNYTGVGQSDAFLLPKIVSHVRSAAASIELGNLDVARDFSDVRDVSATYARLLETPAAIGQTLNVCSGKAYSLKDVLGLVEQISGRRLEVKVNPAFIRQNEVKLLLGSCARLHTLLPRSKDRIPLIDTLRWMIFKGDDRT